MKNITLALCLTFLMAACSSGSSVSEIPPLVSGNYSGSYQSTNNNDTGTMRFNLAQDESNGNITGTFFIETNTSTCLFNGSITSGNITGFNVNLTVDQQVNITTGSTPSTMMTELTDVGDIQFTLTATGNTLEGTYVATSDTCSNQSGSGSVNLSR